MPLLAGLLLAGVLPAGALQDPNPQPPQPGRLWAGATKCIVAAGEEITFRVQSPLAGPAAYRIAEDSRVSPLAEGAINLVPNTPSLVKATLKHPGFLLLEVSQGNRKALAGVAVDPLRIASVAKEPADFDAFWKAELETMRAVPMKPRVEERKGGSVRKLILDHVEGRKVYGWVVIPEGRGPFPAVLEFPPYGASALPPPSGITGAIVALVSVHNSDPEAPAKKAYAPGNAEDHRKNYFKYGLLGGLRMIDYLQTLPSFDRRGLIVTGKSQGGGLSIMAAGLDPRITHVSAVVPAFGQHAGTRHGRSSGFPWWVWQRDQGGSRESGDKLLKEVEYYDITHFARRFRGTAHVMAGYIDTVCPPSSIVAAFNAFPGPKELIHGTVQGHDWNLHGENWWPVWNSRLKDWVAAIRRPR